MVLMNWTKLRDGTGEDGDADIIGPNREVIHGSPSTDTHFIDLRPSSDSFILKSEPPLLSKLIYRPRWYGFSRTASMRRTQRPNDARRRTGCWTCKEKHLRCTEEKPQCARCSRLDISCEYGQRLLWQEDAVQRGILLGREGAWTKSGKPKPKQQAAVTYFLPVRNEPLFLHTTYEDFAANSESYHESDYEEENEDQDRRHAYQLTSHPTALTHLSSHEAYLFDYFTAAICPSCSLSSVDNPYLRYIAPMSFNYSPLHDAIIAIAATERGHQNDRRFAREAWHHKTRALQGVRETIASGVVTWPFVATVLMLTFGDIADGCSNSWTTHLRGGLSVLTNIRAECTESQKLRKFCLMYFAAHDIMGNTAGSSSETLAYSWLEDDDLDEIDPLMGCSRTLLDAIRQITTTFAEASRSQTLRGLKRGDIENLAAFRANFERLLCAIPQYPPPTSTNASLLAVAEAKRTTALLYLESRFRATLLTCPDTAVPQEASAQRISRLAASLIAQVESLPVTPVLLWPLFVLANASPDNEEHRRFVLDRLDSMLRGRNLGSIRLARRLAERTFRDHDLGKRAKLETLGSFNDKRISLA